MKDKLKLAWEFTGHVLPFAMALLLMIRGIQVLKTHQNAAIIMFGLSMIIGSTKSQDRR